MSYCKNILIAVDQLVNTIFKGYPDETLSSRAYRWEIDGIKTWPRKLIDKIFFWEKDHCKESYNSEKDRSQMPQDLRD